MEIINIVVLSLSGLLLTYAGTMRLTKPLTSLCLKAYLDNPDIKLESKVDVFSEMRGAGGSLAISGIVILLGIIIPELTLASFVVAILTFLGYGFGRLVSLKSDGKPNQQIVQALITELILGTANTFCLVGLLV
jgi:hypothetical protein